MTIPKVGVVPDSFILAQEEFYGREVILADREMIEQNAG